MMANEPVALTGPSSHLKVNKVWPLERYARLLQEQYFSQPPKSQGGGNWKHYSSSTDGLIQMSLHEDNHLMITSGNQIYESISLWEARKWLKGVTKGDSALFIYRLNTESRRFRVKFSPICPGGSSLDTCRHCISILSVFIPMSEMPTPTHNQLQLPSLSSSSLQPTLVQPLCVQSFKPGVCSSKHAPGIATAESCESAGFTIRRDIMTVPEIAKVVEAKKQCLGRAYESTNFPTEQIGPFIKLCLTDANFPAFVEIVEKELNDITQKY